ncbi:MAG: glycosyltransferase family 2 protein [Proteobacteria bacterium]|nr:glycosyltransferase family 2 protein [Desulfobacteraceae bacterium]MBU4013903.1 glycosyltransferase family 2 protein [Pseudomonadota bacterium]MBU4127251.1 glycosyltransferase family 2 protein [Pseudomonadota bacterium]
MKKQAIIIIPAYNEEKNIAGVINGIKNVIPNTDILVVNDGGEDRTEEIARELGARVISLSYNMGYGVALQTGFKFALKRGYEYAVQIDADGQHDPEDIPKLLDGVFNNKADVIIGSRFLGKGNYRAPFIRRVGMLFFAWLTSLIIGKKITDPTSGYQAINKRGLQFYAGDNYPVDFPDADVIIMLHRAGLKIKEIPVNMNPSIQKKSMHSGLKPVYYIFKMFLSILVTLLRKAEI